MRKLWSGRIEDSEVRIELPIEHDVFSIELGCQTNEKTTECWMVFQDLIGMNVKYNIYI